ncbi:MAG: Gfo/Idh/MocA family protein [Sciscionella sp.]
MPRTPARLALIGAGAIADEHCAAIGETADLELVRVVDRHAERAQALAARYGTGHSGEPASLYHQDVDAVIVCTSPDSHVSLATAALTAGKAVLLEKPAALELASVDELLAVASRTRAPLLVGQTARFQPAHLELAAALADGQVGTPRLIHVSWYAGHVWPGGWRGWQLDPLRSGGHVLHNGVHALDLVTWLMDDTPARVFARPLRTWTGEMPTPDSFHIIIEFTGGGQAVVELSYGLTRRGSLLRRVLIAGTDGTACVSTDDEPSADTAPPLPPAGVAGAMLRQYAHFRDVLISGAAPLTSPAQIRGALVAAIAAERSSRTRRVVEAGALR